MPAFDLKPFLAWPAQADCPFCANGVSLSIQSLFSHQKQAVTGLNKPSPPRLASLGDSHVQTKPYRSFACPRVLLACITPKAEAILGAEWSVCVYYRVQTCIINKPRLVIGLRFIRCVHSLDLRLAAAAGTRYLTSARCIFSMHKEASREMGMVWLPSSSAHSRTPVHV